MQQLLKLIVLGLDCRSKVLSTQTVDFLLYAKTWCKNNFNLCCLMKIKMHSLSDAEKSSDTVQIDNNVGLSVT